MLWAARRLLWSAPLEAPLFGALCLSLFVASPALTDDAAGPWLMNRNHRKPGKANAGKRAVSHHNRKAKRPRKGTPTISGRGRHPKGQ